MGKGTTLTESELLLLVAAAQGGDTDAYGKIYHHYFESVYRYAAFRVPMEVAEDLVAEIFIQVWEKLHTYKPQKDVPFGAWLFRIARHKVIDAYRSMRNWEEVQEETVDPDELNRADSAVRRKELVRIVRKALAKLPERYSEVLHLSYMADLPSDEVARVLKLREGTVRVLKMRALRKLESFLPPEIRRFDEGN